MMCQGQSKVFSLPQVLGNQLSTTVLQSPSCNPTFYKMQVNLLPVMICKPINSGMFPCTSLPLAAFLNSDYWVRAARGRNARILHSLLGFTWRCLLSFRVFFILVLWQIPGHQGAEGHFLNTGQHGGGKDLLQNLRDVLSIHGNERPASW